MRSGGVWRRRCRYDHQSCGCGLLPRYERKCHHNLVHVQLCDLLMVHSFYLNVFTAVSVFTALLGYAAAMPTAESEAASLEGYEVCRGKGRARTCIQAPVCHPAKPTSFRLTKIAASAKTPMHKRFWISPLTCRTTTAAGQSRWDSAVPLLRTFTIRAASLFAHLLVVCPFRYYSEFTRLMDVTE